MEEEDENKMKAYCASQAQFSQNLALTTAMAYWNSIASCSFLDEEDIHTQDEEDIHTLDEVEDIHNILAASLKD